MCLFSLFIILNHFNCSSSANKRQREVHFDIALDLIITVVRSLKDGLIDCRSRFMK
jgi:hypothetical protein